MCVGGLVSVNDFWRQDEVYVLFDKTQTRNPRALIFEKRGGFLDQAFGDGGSRSDPNSLYAAKPTCVERVNVINQIGWHSLSACDAAQLI